MKNLEVKRSRIKHKVIMPGDSRRDKEIRIKIFRLYKIGRRR
jgi:hypothetical protein